MISWGYSCNWKDDSPSQQPHFALQHSLTLFSPEHPLLKHFLSLQWRSCWRDALSLLIQPSVGAQASIHSCHILILSLGLASGSPVKELTVWRVKRDQDWYTEIHLQIRTVTQTPKHLPRKKHKNMLTHIHTLKYTSVTLVSSVQVLDIRRHLRSYLIYLALFVYDHITITLTFIFWLVIPWNVTVSTWDPSSQVMALVWPWTVSISTKNVFSIFVWTIFRGLKRLKYPVFVKTKTNILERSERKTCSVTLCIGIFCFFVFFLSFWRNHLTFWEIWLFAWSQTMNVVVSGMTLNHQAAGDTVDG